MTRENRIYTYILITLAAIQTYFTAYPRSAGAGPSMSSWRWGLVAQYWPIGAMTILIAWHWFGRRSGSSIQSREDWDAVKKETIVGKTYRNEQVVIDCKRFVNCNFHDVIFIFEGRGPFEFDGQCDISTPIKIQTTHPAVQTFMTWADALKQLPGVTESTSHRVDSLGNLSPIPPIHVFGVRPKGTPKPKVD